MNETRMPQWMRAVTRNVRQDRERTYPRGIESSTRQSSIFENRLDVGWCHCFGAALSPGDFGGEKNNLWYCRLCLAFQV